MIFTLKKWHCCKKIPFWSLYFQECIQWNVQ